jgi:hypothetical protein
MHQSIYLDCGNNSLETCSEELTGYLKYIGAEFIKTEPLGFRVNGPQNAVDMSHKANVYHSYPFFDPSN